MENSLIKYKDIKKENGITLIALVITIIVLLILAGVSIAMLTGQNGILNQANQAKKETENANIDELKRLAQAEANMNLEDKIYTDKKGKTVTIPAGFAVSNIEEEKVIDTGLVVIDKNGNEWVWIEVPKTVTASANTDSEIETALQTYAKDYRQSEYTDTYYDGCGLANATEYNNLKSKMLQSIKTNGGFYIGKYEMGTETQRKAEGDKLTTPLTQQDKYVYTHVTCSQAQGLATQLSTEGKTSSLMFGIQWDLVLNYIKEKGAKTQEELKTSSTTWGNYQNATFNITRGKYSTDGGQNYTDVNGTYTKPTPTNVLLTTGASERNSVLNIYDLTGNVWEWTLEKSSSASDPCTFRGGSYTNIGDSFPAFSRYSFSTSNTFYDVAYRPALY